MTLIPEHIIKEAIEKGFAARTHVCGETNYAPYSEILLDPDFWFCLSIARPHWSECSANHGDYWEGKHHRDYEAHKFFSLLLSSPTQEQVDAYWHNLP